jgi:signal transduction histidine kinase
MSTNIRQWFSTPYFEGDEDKVRAATLINFIVWLFIIAAIAYGVFAPIDPEFQYRRILIIAPFLLFLLFIKQMLNRGYIRFTGTLVVFSLWLIFTVAMLFGADYQNPAIMGYLVVVICAGLILNWRAAIGWSLFSILTNAVILYLGLNGILPPSDRSVSPLAFWSAQTLYILVATLLLSQTIRKIDEALAKTQREIAERKRVEAERENIIQELETKNAELERFTYTVSHDLKSPLITIGGFLGLLEKDALAGDTEKMMQDLSRIREAKDKMYRLLDELLDLSRIGRLMNPPENVSFAEIVDDALKLTEGQLKLGKIKVTVQENLPVVHGDRPRLVEVMQNLIDNAAKFSIGQPDPQIEIGAGKKSDEHVFFVKDNGIGIDPAFHEKIFGLFNKLDPKSNGTGVGLTLVKRIIDVHGGQIWVESDGRGEGCTFCFTFPERAG